MVAWSRAVIMNLQKPRGLEIHFCRWQLGVFWWVGCGVSGLRMASKKLEDAGTMY